MRIRKQRNYLIDSSIEKLSSAQVAQLRLEIPVEALEEPFGQELVFEEEEEPVSYNKDWLIKYVCVIKAM
jgi:hypothetical protein